MNGLIDSNLLLKIEKLLNKARAFVATTVNTTLLTTYMEIGRLIVTDLKKHSDDETYETQSITALSRELSKKLVKGFLEQIFGT